MAVSSGTDALHLAYNGLGVQTGDVGIVPSITFVATANGLRYNGAAPVFCCVDSQTGVADQANLESGIRIADAKGRKVKVLVPVSYSGRMSCLEKLRILRRGITFLSWRMPLIVGELQRMELKALLVYTRVQQRLAFIHFSIFAQEKVGLL